ncbi:acetoin dehydrogenase dihydrolipoyllysine-residue acetyltransferase subunit [Lichenicoccus sp.]|uniref:acetoin dehydrogenase dihydrolipoyllysine-residue acetyltransferase subunit n=1 Tax=Lichenicoccus sp. TaxID=2781899 RepID=UPI003D0C2239
MIAELTLPRLGETMETGRVAAWLKQPGDRFRRGETLVEIESDKTVVEMPALGDGVLTEILIATGQDAKVGAVLCRYEDGAGPAATPRATPRARALARQERVDLADLTGTGRRGRIEVSDIHPPTPESGVRFVEVPGGRIAYRDWTGGDRQQPHVVLLHGLAADLQSWATLAAALARAGCHVTAIDLPGHGDTSLNASGFNEMADAVALFLERLGGAPVELVGHSLGGALAARVARRARIARLTLLAPVGLDRAIDVEFVRDIVRVRAVGALQHLLRRLSVRPATLTTAQQEALVAELSRGRLVGLSELIVDTHGQQVDITTDLRACAMPVRLVWGLQDRIIPWTQVSQAPSRSAIHLIQDAGHVPHWDQPAEVAALFD